jgi:hypothetical protein
MRRMVPGLILCIALAACGSSSSGGGAGSGGTPATGGAGGTPATGGTGGSMVMPDGAVSAKPPRKVMKKVTGTFPPEMLMVMDGKGKMRKVGKVKLKNPKTKNTVGISEVHEDGHYEIDVGIYGEVHYVFLIEDEDGYAIGQLGHYPSADHQTDADIESDFPLDQGGDDGPDAATDIGLGAMRTEIVDGEVIFLSETSPTVFVDTDEDGMSDYTDNDDDNDGMTDDMDPSDDGDATDDTMENAEDVATEEAQEPPDEGGDPSFVPHSDDTVHEETAEEEMVTEDAP